MHQSLISSDYIMLVTLNYWKLRQDVRRMRRVDHYQITSQHLSRESRVDRYEITSQHLSRECQYGRTLRTSIWPEEERKVTFAKFGRCRGKFLEAVNWAKIRLMTRTRHNAHRLRVIFSTCRESPRKRLQHASLITWMDFATAACNKSGIFKLCEAGVICVDCAADSYARSRETGES